MLTPKQLRSRRIALRLTARELASLLGIEDSDLDAWERGEVSIPDPDAVESALDAIEDDAERAV
jgi:transcriptional regulator with XRE-family HTH domain